MKIIIFLRCRIHLKFKKIHYHLPFLNLINWYFWRDSYSNLKMLFYWLTLFSSSSWRQRKLENVLPKKEIFLLSRNSVSRIRYCNFIYEFKSLLYFIDPKTRQVIQRKYKSPMVSMKIFNTIGSFWIYFAWFFYVRFYRLARFYIISTGFSPFAWHNTSLHSIRNAMHDTTHIQSKI